jgi:polysaccharide chain length determinant protein (PEP-CTERM system associated)
MLAQDGFGIQRRDLDVEDYIDIARRHKAWIMGPAFAALVIAVVGAYLWPDTYVSTASIKVVPQQVPTNYVQANVNQAMQDRISSLAQSIMSRNMLTSLVNTLQLYPQDTARKPIDDVVEDMRKDIKITQPQAMAVGSSSNAVPAFQISFSYTDRYKAQRVVQKLQTDFIEENFRNRRLASQMTSQLLKDNWDQARKEMEGIETRLAEFRARNQGRLPDQMQGALQQLNVLQARATSLNESLSRISQDRLVLEGTLRIIKDEINAAKQPVSVERAMARKSERLQDADREIAVLENSLARLRERYNDTHPDVQQMIGMVAAAKKKRDALMQEDENAKKASSDDTAPSEMILPAQLKEARSLETHYRSVEMQINAKNLEAENIHKELERVNDQMRVSEARMQGTPLSDKEYSDLLQAQQLARQKFNDLDNKMTRSAMAQQMEDRQQGETLEPLDPPTLPMTPSKPKRLVIIGVGAGFGFIFGLVLAGAREVKDSSLKNLKDVRAYTQMSILGSIPLLENDLVIRRRRRMAWLAWSLACLAGIAIMSGSIVYYYATKA